MPQFLPFQIPPSPCYLLFQPQTCCAPIPNADIPYMRGTLQAGPQGLARLHKSATFAKLLWPVRRPEAMPQRPMLAAGAGFQPGHAGNMPCPASWSQKLRCFLLCHFFFPHFVDVSHYFHSTSTLESNRKSYSPLQLAFPFPLAITTSRIVKRVAGRILLLCHSAFYKAIKEKAQKL